MHLAVTLFRHGRGMLNAVEKFERTIPREHRATEFASLIEFARAACAAAEKNLTAASE